MRTVSVPRLCGACERARISYRQGTRATQITKFANPPRIVEIVRLPKDSLCPINCYVNVVWYRIVLLKVVAGVYEPKLRTF